jgi:hypothetical protein
MVSMILLNGKPDNPRDPWRTTKMIPGSEGSTVYDRYDREWVRYPDGLLDLPGLDTWYCPEIDRWGDPTGSFGPFTNERKPQVATKLVSTQHAEAQAKLAELKAQLDKVQESLAGYTPVEPIEYGTVVRFRKYQSYTYAAIKVPAVGGTVWYLTQNPTRPQDRKSPKTWSELLDFIGERNYHTIEVLS